MTRAFQKVRKPPIATALLALGLLVAGCPPMPSDSSPNLPPPNGGNSSGGNGSEPNSPVDPNAPSDITSLDAGQTAAVRDVAAALAAWWRTTAFIAPLADAEIERSALGGDPNSVTSLTFGVCPQATLVRSSPQVDYSVALFVGASCGLVGVSEPACVGGNGQGNYSIETRFATLNVAGLTCGSAEVTSGSYNGLLQRIGASSSFNGNWTVALGGRTLVLTGDANLTANAGTLSAGTLQGDFTTADVDAAVTADNLAIAPDAGGVLTPSGGTLTLMSDALGELEISFSPAGQQNQTVSVRLNGAAPQTVSLAP